MSALSLSADDTGQQERRARAEPGLVVETGARMGTCDVLAFTKSGSELVATGDDKVVRVWPVNADGINPKSVRTLRWSIWHEQRGNLYALALDKDERRVAIAGKGVVTSRVAILDFHTGEVLKVLTDTKGNDKVIRALAFSPSGNHLAIGSDDGSVWLWDLSTGENDVQRLGSEPKAAASNPVRLLYFEQETQLLSVAFDGKANIWSTVKPEAPPTVRFEFMADREQPVKLHRVAISPDGQWLAAGGVHPCVEIRSRDGQRKREINLSGPNEVPKQIARSLAFDRTGDRLAIGIRSIERLDFFYGTNDQIVIYDLKPATPSPTPGPKCSYHAEALAFHPDEQCLAVAGGDNHEISYWNLATRKAVGETVRGPGSALWAIGLSADNRYLGFREQRAARPTVNERGSGPWRVFDLNRRRFQPANFEFQPAAPVETGWKVTFSENFVFDWSVIAPDGRRFTLSLDSGGQPLCYAFLSADGKTPVRLAVGQYYGSVSVFELDEPEPRKLDQGYVLPTRVYTVHQGEIMGIAASADQQWLVTASRDGTIAALSLADWPSGNELGAGFVQHDGRVFVKSVDTGGPAWEAGLNLGDEIRLLAFDGRRPPVYNRTNTEGGPAGTPEACIARLNNPIPGKEFRFDLLRPGQRSTVPAATRIFRRPQWRFFPTRDRDWAIWLWRSYYYDTSTHGDSLIGWHINRGPAGIEKPQFFSADKLRTVYHRQDIVHKLLWEPKIDVGLQSLVKVRPPEVKIDIVDAENRPADKDVTVIIRAVSQDRANPDQHLTRADLWIDDFRYATWEIGGTAFSKPVTIPASALRTGDNQLTFQCRNAKGGLDEATARIAGAPRDGLPDLYGLVIGVGDYGNSRGPTGRLGDLPFTITDARAIREAWLRQSGKRFREAEITPLLNQNATRAAILRHLAQLREKVRPDDLLVVSLGGHGYDQLGGNADRFVFCCTDFDSERAEQTGLTSQTLYEHLAMLRCRKLVLLDVCHSGLVANPVRGLTPGGKGPTILASCDKAESAAEIPGIDHGLFTYALIEALGNQFDKADTDGDQKLNANELFTYSERRLPELLRDIGHIQNPTCFPKRPDRFPLAVK
jgi:WD40 repeat protein